MNLIKISLVLVAIFSQVTCNTIENKTDGGNDTITRLLIVNERNFFGERIDIPEYNFTFQLNNEEIVGTVSNAAIFGMGSFFDNMNTTIDVPDSKITTYTKIKNVTIKGSAKVRIISKATDEKSSEIARDPVFSILLENIIIKCDYRYSLAWYNISLLNLGIMSISHLAIQSVNDDSKWYLDRDFSGEKAIQNARVLHITQGIENCITSIMNNNLRTMALEGIQLRFHPPSVTLDTFESIRKIEELIKSNSFPNFDPYRFENVISIPKNKMIDQGELKNIYIFGIPKNAHSIEFRYDASQHKANIYISFHEISIVGVYKITNTSNHHRIQDTLPIKIVFQNVRIQSQYSLLYDEVTLLYLDLEAFNGVTFHKNGMNGRTSISCACFYFQKILTDIIKEIMNDSLENLTPEKIRQQFGSLYRDP